MIATAKRFKSSGLQPKPGTVIASNAAVVNGAAGLGRRAIKS
jgi:hypothetical protein